MELYQFYKIVRRSWALVLGLPLLALALALVVFKLPPQRYRLIAKIAVSQAGIAPSDSSFPDFNSYHSWAASEYVADDLPEIVNSAAFAEDLRAWLLANRGIDVATPEVQAALTADRVHRVLNLQVDGPSPEASRGMAEGVAALLQQKGLAYWNRAQTGGLNVALLELPAATPQTRWRDPLITLGLRVFLGLALGLLLAFVRHALDHTIREDADLEALGLELVAAIPAEPRARRRGLS